MAEFEYGTSAPLLDARSVAFQPLFAPMPVHDTLYFDEGPRIPNYKSNSTSSLSGAMDTRGVDPYTQGVEITQQRQYDAGLVKIWSGEPGHKLLYTRFGMDRNYFPDPGFAEMDYFNPVRYLEAQEHDSPLWWNIMTFPIVTGDNDQAENFDFNGIIEPLSIRSLVAFFSTETPFEAHAVRANMVGGNINQIGGSDRILSVDYFEPTREMIGFLDMIDMEANRPTVGFFRHEFATLLPFKDERFVRNQPLEGSESPEAVAALSNMTGSTDNYVRHNQKSAACGWYYDNNSGVGTDSLTFGGMTY